ncbi:MAG: hypothetical protein KDK66_08345, partial [Deltaproteobacteria bacterium]|nr:hypothetical protein [Deltaproteobacteria bacterium]
MLFSIFQKALKTPIQPVVLVTGEESFSRQRLINKLIDQLLEPSLRAMNLAKLSLSEEKLEEAIKG